MQRCRARAELNEGGKNLPPVSGNSRLFPSLPLSTWHSIPFLFPLSTHSSSLKPKKDKEMFRKHSPHQVANVPTALPSSLFSRARFFGFPQSLLLMGQNKEMRRMGKTLFA
ncbi:hypothetical protein TNIN_173121 [Trichonephila inaurata madagascariensis]|uniref:Uncharacterized protein n=1 Tax=Trichonephila inaurata madagascariensis TaxID=2747483 RepID=A0A8X6X646_9ARAC|nr:hypothetical protein TNIN_173121 [Trichonephila inaurata madagascariensis]